MAITVNGCIVTIATARLQAVFNGLRLVRLATADGRILAESDPASAGPAGLELLFADRAVLPLGQGPGAQVSAVKLGENVAQVAVNDDMGEGWLLLTTDAAGRLLIEPAAHTLKYGLAAVRWNVAGMAPGLKLVAPFFQGVRQDLEHSLVANQRWGWPHGWEAALLILQGERGGFSVCAHDEANVPKAVQVGHSQQARTCGFETEAHGPWDRNTACGSLTWILDTHAGGWEEPAAAYRDWLRATLDYRRLAALRPDWVNSIRLTLQWSSCQREVLDALAKIVDPRKVLIHACHWRRDPYDENYPEYVAGENGASTVAYAQERGYRVLPHFNYFAIDPNHPLSARVLEFAYRDPYGKGLQGWRWRDGGCPPFPQGHVQLYGHRDEKVMAYIHTGASVWRRELVLRVAAARAALQCAGVFVDQTLCTWNLDNALVENQSCTCGMVALTRELAALDGPPAVGGEGLNEMSMRYESFAQAHLFRSWHTSCPKFNELDPVPVGHFLYGELCRTMAYTNITGDTPDSAWRLEVHERLNALPSLTLNKAEQVERPNPAVRRVLDRATS